MFKKGKRNTYLYWHLTSLAMVEKKLPGGTDSTRKFISSSRNFSNLLKAFYNFYLQVGNRNFCFKIISVRLNMLVLVVNGIPRPERFFGQNFWPSTLKMLTYKWHTYFFLFDCGLFQEKDPNWNTKQTAI